MFIVLRLFVSLPGTSRSAYQYRIEHLSYLVCSSSLSIFRNIPVVGSLVDAAAVCPGRRGTTGCVAVSLESSADLVAGAGCTACAVVVGVCVAE